MSQIEIIEHLLELVAGIGVYLIAFKMISGNLEAVSSEKLKQTFAKISDNKIIGLFIGIVATVFQCRYGHDDRFRQCGHPVFDAGCDDRIRR